MNIKEALRALDEFSKIKYDSHSYAYGFLSSMVEMGLSHDEMIRYITTTIKENR
jgi:hypothetical protein